MGKSDSGLYFLFILLIFQTVVAVSKARIVAVPKFTLVRVVGNEAIIPCTVSDYDPQVEQDFEWNFSQGNQNIDIISTLDPSYPDSKYKNRVVAGDIMIKRINDSAANLHIKNLQLSDAGTYICKTPSTDSVVKGNYDDSVGMNVIPDGVKVAVPPDIQQQLGDLVEGEEFQLKCSISKNSTECTQISITFEVKTETNGNLQVLSLTQDGKLQPGTKYTERFQSGHIRLETHDDIYLLSVSHALLSDTGTYSSTVTEWIKQQDGTWQVVQQKGVQLAKVNIERIAQVLSVSAVIGNLTLSKGEDTDLTCYIKTGNSNAVSKEVVWYFSTYPTATPGNEKLLASMDRNSMMNRSDYGIISRMDASTYQYMVRNAKETDSGYYYCSVTLWLQESKNTWYRAAEKISDAVQLNVTVSEPTFKVQVTTSTIPTFAEEPAELKCTVSDLQNADDTLLTASWYFTPMLPADQTATRDLIATVKRDFTVLTGDKYRDRVDKGLIIVSKPESTSFTLRIQWSEDSDRGNYSCSVSAWAKQDGNWEESKTETSSDVNIFWVQEEPKVFAKAVSQGSPSSAGSAFEMICSVSSQNIKGPHYSVLITREQPSSNVKKLISLNHEAVVTLEDKAYLGNVVLEKTKEDQFRFRISQTQISDIGLYYCTATAWTPSGGGTWKETVSAKSNGIKIEFQSTGPTFNVTLHSDSPTVHQFEMVELQCTISLGETPDGASFSLDNAAYDVFWFAVRSYDNSINPTFLASMSRTGMVTQARRNGSSDLSVERIGLLQYRLRVHGTRDEDFGNHFCSVTPWVRNSDSSWIKSEEIKSNEILVTVHADLLSSFKIPVVCGIGVSLAVGLLACLIGYCSARFCCKKDVKEARRDHRRLMSMEMD